jgi:hypothetical protein
MNKDSFSLITAGVTALGRLGTTTLIVICIMYTASQIKDIAVAWAGKSTTAVIAVDVAANGKAEWGNSDSHDPLENAETNNQDIGNDALTQLCFYVGAVGLLVGLFGLHIAGRQRKLRQETVTHLAPYKTMYEELVDRQRSTSGLMHDGETRPEDK